MSLLCNYCSYKVLGNAQRILVDRIDKINGKMIMYVKQ